MFSQYIKYLLHKLQFAFIVLGRFIRILFRWKKGIKLLKLDYTTDHVFDNSFIIINYRFRNAIWYRFGNHKTLEKEIKIFNLKNFDNEFDLVAYGFFQNKRYRLTFEPQLTLDNSNFKTSFSNLTLKLEKKIRPTIITSGIPINMPKPTVIFQNISIITDSYNQNEFI